MRTNHFKIQSLFLRGALTALVLMITWGCTSNPPQQNDKDISSWQGGMQLLASHLRELTPYAFSSQDFGSPEQRAHVQSLLSKFAKDIHHLPVHVGEKLLGQDPFVKYSIDRLEDNTNLAAKSFEDGHPEFARTILRRNVGLCFNCHTSQDVGPQLQWADSTINSKLRMSPIERSEYYVATRQFEKALSTLAAEVDSPMTLMENPREQLDALRRYLYLQVRVKKNPGPAILLLDKYLSWEHLPYFMAEDAKNWMKSLREWQKEKDPKSANINLAKRLIKKAHNLQQIGFNAGLVYDLRASSILHEQLARDLKPKEKAEVYRMLGQSYDSLSELGLWNLPELYFQACIKTVPGTQVAKDCYIDFEKSIVLGFSGSSGVHIPKKDRELLKEMKALAGFDSVK